MSSRYRENGGAHRGWERDERRAHDSPAKPHHDSPRVSENRQSFKGWLKNGNGDFKRGSKDRHRKRDKYTERFERKGARKYDGEGERFGRVKTYEKSVDRSKDRLDYSKKSEGGYQRKYRDEDRG